VARWRESRSIKAQVRNLIYENLLWLPSESYSDEEVDLKAVAVYQHVFANYQGGGKCVCQPDGVGNLLSDLRRLKR
jgi:type I restriction enzyme R subunit